MSLPDVLILGGGFAGLAAARALKHAVLVGQCTVSLIDACRDTAMVPALPDYAAGLLPRAWLSAPIPKLLPPFVCFEQTRVCQIDPKNQRVETSAGPRSFDYLIVAMGSSADTDYAEQAEADHRIKSYPLTHLREAEALKNTFEERLRTHTPFEIVISGAGYTGVELAICMARRARQEQNPVPIHLIEINPEIMPFLTPKQKVRVLASLARHEIQLHTNCSIAGITDREVALSDGYTATNPILCRTEGTRASANFSNTGIESRADGRLPVRSSLVLAAYPNVFLAGDAAAFDTPRGDLRKAVNFAFYGGTHAGRNVARRIARLPARPFHPIDLGWVIPLGDDSVGKAFAHLPLQGRYGLALHYIMCGYRNYSLTNFLRFAGHAVRAGRPTQQKEEKT